MIMYVHLHLWQYLFHCCQHLNWFPQHHRHNQSWWKSFYFKITPGSWLYPYLLSSKSTLVTLRDLPWTFSGPSLGPLGPFWTFLGPSWASFLLRLSADSTLSKKWSAVAYFQNCADSTFPRDRLLYPWTLRSAHCTSSKCAHVRLFMSRLHIRK